MTWRFPKSWEYPMTIIHFIIGFYPVDPHPFWRFPPQVPQVPQVPHHAISNKAVAVANLKIFLLVLNVGNGWVAGGCWDAKIDSDYGSFPKHSLRLAPVSFSEATCLSRGEVDKERDERDWESENVWWNQPNILKDLEDSRPMVIDGLAGLEWDHKHDQIQHKISEPGGSKSLRMGDFPWSWLIYRYWDSRWRGKYGIQNDT